MAEYQIIKTGGFVNIKDVSSPESFEKLDFTGAVGSFYTRLGSTSVSPANANTLTIFHAVAGHILTGIVTEFTTPSDASLITLRPIIDALLNTPSSSVAPMEPFNTIFVSGTHGSSTGTGAIDSPIDTIAAGTVLAETAALADGTRWEVRILAGEYDEQLFPAAGLQRISFTLATGAGINYTDVSAVIDDTNNNVLVVMEAGTYIIAAGGGAVATSTAKRIDIQGSGIIVMESAYSAIECVGGEINCNGIAFINSAGSATPVVDCQSGLVRMTECTFEHEETSAVMAKSGGELKLYRCSIMTTVATESISSPDPQDVQVMDCVSTVAVGADITETVGAFIVDAAFTL